MALWVFSQCVAMATILVLGVRLLPKIGALRRADVVVLMTRWGHGHTITGPDIARRVYRGKRCVFVVLSEFPLHNWKTALMWPDISVLFVPYTLGFRWKESPVSLPYPRWYIRLMPRALDKLARVLAKPGTPVLSLHQLYTSIPIPKSLQAPFDPRTGWWRAEPDERLRFLNVAYIWLQREVPVPHVHLPERWRRRVRSRLSAVVGQQQKPFCCLYLRQKGAGSSLSFESRRVGSPLVDYLDGVQALIQAGYQVAVTGDVQVPPGMSAQFGGMLVDARALRIDPQVFSLYAATEAALFVGETGGGTWLPGINGISRLVLNAYPYYYGYPNCWMFYKYVTDAQGRLVPYRELFEHHAYDWDLPGMTIHNNTGEEIRDAIAAFLQDLGHPAPAAEQGFQFPEHTWAFHARSKLSSTWLRRYRSSVPSEVRVP